jgi:hypothetical protein
MATTEERLAAHEATLGQMHERLGRIEATVREIKARMADNALVVGLVLGLWGWVTLLIRREAWLRR